MLPGSACLTNSGVLMHFFFSYSRDDAGDAYLRRFYHDLRAEVAVRGGVALEEAGFLDVEQPAGELWPGTTGKALGECAVFVPVYSMNFFKSSSCGQEWSAFAARSAHLPGSSGHAPKGIRPVWWVPPENEPAVAEYLEDTRDQFGADYRRYGLRYLMQLSQNADQYQEFLVKFTLMILEAAKNPPPAREITNLLEEPNTFAVRVIGADVQATGTVGRQSGTAGRRSWPRHVTFAFAVAKPGGNASGEARSPADAWQLRPDLPGLEPLPSGMPGFRRVPRAGNSWLAIDDGRPEASRQFRVSVARLGKGE